MKDALVSSHGVGCQREEELPCLLLLKGALAASKALGPGFAETARLGGGLEFSVSQTCLLIRITRGAC